MAGEAGDVVRAVSRMEDECIVLVLPDDEMVGAGAAIEQVVIAGGGDVIVTVLAVQYAVVGADADPVIAVASE